MDPVVAVPNDKCHVNRRGALCICRRQAKHSTPPAPKRHSSAAFEQLAPSSYSVRRWIHQRACECVSAEESVRVCVLIPFPSSSSPLVRRCQASVVLSAITALNSSSRLCVERVCVRMYVCMHACMDNSAAFEVNPRICSKSPLDDFQMGFVKLGSNCEKEKRLTLVNWEHVSMPALHSFVWFLLTLKTKQTRSLSISQC